MFRNKETYSTILALNARETHNRVHTKTIVTPLWFQKEQRTTSKQPRQSQFHAILDNTIRYKRLICNSYTLQDKINKIKKYLHE